jgi:hypothetical protein
LRGHIQRRRLAQDPHRLMKPVTPEKPSECAVFWAGVPTDCPPSAADGNGERPNLRSLLLLSLSGPTLSPPNRCSSSGLPTRRRPVYATLLDEGQYYGSVRTMYRRTGQTSRRASARSRTRGLIAKSWDCRLSQTPQQHFFSSDPRLQDLRGVILLSEDGSFCVVKDLHFLRTSARPAYCSLSAPLKHAPGVGLRCDGAREIKQRLRI